jgi:hypothetical protein
VVRNNEAFISGHSDLEFRRSYDVQAAQNTQTCITALQEKCDTAGPLLELDLPSRTSLGDDRRATLEDLRRSELAKKIEKADLKKEIEDPMDLTMKMKLVRSALDVDSNWIENQARMRELEWMKYTFQMMAANSAASAELRNCMREIICGEGRRKMVKFVVNKLMKKKLSQQLVDKDGCPVYNIVIWAYSAVKEFRLKNV